jgi:MSHA biogenesis protein MshN
MSVINKMLRDLDQRQSPATGAADPLRRDTNSVADLPAVRRPAPVLRWALAVLLVVTAAAGALVWWSSHQTPPAAPVAAPSVAPAPVVAPAPSVAMAASGAAASELAVATTPVALEPALAVPASELVPPPARTASARAGLRMETVLSSPSVAAQTVLPAPVPLVTPASKTVVQSAAVVSTLPAPAAPVSVKAPAPQAESPSAATRQQQAAREALAQAQALWASGAQDSAINGLQEAVAATERGTQGAAGASVTLVPLVRELARMELAEGRPAAVWDMLVRLESLLANQPELWALRANAAQRLGRHQDSVQAYTMALQSRPNEQRWLLGAAVSLAALGQTGPAAEMADKARAVGPVSREVLAYLRQQGVPLTDRP